MALELALFARFGLEVELNREVGWATIRDKIIYGELDAAHAPAGTAIAATLGLGCIPTPCVTGLVLNLHGNAVTLSEQLWRDGVRDGGTLRELIGTRAEPMTFGVAFQFSSHNFLLRCWLRANGIDPDRDVRLVVIPPAQMFANLEAGHLDGYCVGEPWNSLAVLSRRGWCVAASEDIARNHPEKVLMVREDFAEERAPEHVALVAALLEACRFCDQPENRERVIETLALPEYVNAPIHALRMSMCGSFDFGHGRIEKYPDFNVFSRNGANEPDARKAAWVLDMMERSGVLPDRSLISASTVQRIFRTDIYDSARTLLAARGASI
ncbi:MAG: Nitrate transporter, ATP-binding protein NtrC [Chthoniobacter sp.]|jgi:ABC-type nitrate/sulfonate/bicarbonate transport system substrate-binding protein|nr:Nitrate transporter, ATP-binding protein NtrC [Chthoniobacter sp.]